MEFILIFRMLTRRLHWINAWTQLKVYTLNVCHFPEHTTHVKFFRKMTHISKYNDEVREESVFATPNPRTLGRGVRDFYSERDAAATPRRFTTVATPMSRKIKVQ